MTGLDPDSCFGNHVQNYLDLGYDSAGVIDNPERLEVSKPYGLGPARVDLREVRVLGSPENVDVMLGMKVRQLDLACTENERAGHRARAQAAGEVVETDTAVKFDAGNRRADVLNPIGPEEMLLEKETAIPGISSHLSRFDLAEILLVDAWSGVDVNVNDAVQQPRTNIGGGYGHDRSSGCKPGLGRGDRRYVRLLGH
jgi:hypothetical protein